MSRVEEAISSVRIMAELRRDHTRLERVFIREMRVSFIALGVLVARAASAKGGLFIEEASRREEARIAAILAAAKLKQWGTRVLKPRFEMHWKRVASSTVKILARNKDMEIPSSFRSDLESKLLKEGGRRAGLLDVPADTKRALFAALDQAREEGLGSRQAGRLIRSYVPKGRFIHAGVRYRAELISRTETLYAQRMATIETYRKSPVVDKVVAFDGDKDPECAARDGNTYTLDDAEAQAAMTHPNCILTFAPVV